MPKTPKHHLLYVGTDGWPYTYVKERGPELIKVPPDLYHMIKAWKEDFEDDASARIIADWIKDHTELLHAMNRTKKARESITRMLTMFEKWFAHYQKCP